MTRTYPLSMLWKLALAAALAALPLAAVPARAQQGEHLRLVQSGPHTDRYQMITTSQNAGGYTAVFLMDTWTGRVWTFQAKDGSFEPVPFNSPIGPPYLNPSDPDQSVVPKRSR